MYGNRRRERFTEDRGRLYVILFQSSPRHYNLKMIGQRITAVFL